MERRNLMSPESAQASDIFDKFCTANTLKGILSQYRQLCNVLRLQATHFPDFYPRLRSKLCSWRAQGLWTKFEKRASHKSYARGTACSGCRVLIIGAGPCGLRTAIEAQLLGAKVVLIEKRDRFSRNNVLHIWPFVITDLKALGAKKFYGKFCAGSIDHISIRQLQCILLKVALLLGVEVHEGVGFESLCDPTENEGWRAVTSPPDHPVSQYHFDCLIGADGRRNTLDGFKRKALRAKLAIAITANFINKRTEAEARVKEISGVSYIFNQKFFQDLNEATGIDLENIVYYKDETHYFVMTAKKHSLLQKGVLLHDYADTAKLLSHENISTEALMIYALEAAIFSTENQLPNLDYAVNHYGQPDVAMFDFTAMYAAENACRIVQRKGHMLMMTLVGDSLLEPFWPTGSGCARGFLSCFDACWMLRSLAAGNKSILEVIAERESIYRLLGQTTPENLNKEHNGYTIDPHSRYPNLNQRVVMPFQVRNLFESDVPLEEQVDGDEHLEIEQTTKKRRRDTVIAVDSLLSWLRSQVKCYGLEISDVSDAYVSGDILLAILHRFRPDLIEFPPTSEENVSPAEIAACKNQMAFDFLQKEYGLAPVMNGVESVQCSSSEFLSMVAYLSQLYDIFKGEIPQIKYPKVDGSELDECMSVVPNFSNFQAKHIRPPAVIAKHGAAAKIRRTRVSSSSSRDGRWEGDTSETSRRHRKRRSEERSRINLDDREQRIQEIERNRAERQRRRMQDRSLQTERFIRSMRLLQMNRIEPEKANEHRSFEDYTMHLYRHLAPDFEQRCKILESKLYFSGREHRASTGDSQTDNEKQNVPGLAKDLEEKLKGGSKHVDKKPKDLIRAIGKIEKSDWNVQLIEKKIAENKGHCQGKKDRDDKVPKWSREAFDDKREAMKRKMEGVPEKELPTERAQLFEETLKKVGSKFTDGSALEVGQRGSNKVSQMAEKLTHMVKPSKEVEPKPMVTRPVFEFPKKGGSETCHFCAERVYVVERMTAEGKFFHRNCFRCEYCNTSLRLGNYSFDREGRYGDRFYCLPHYNTIRLYGWKKYDREGVVHVPEGKLPESRNLLLPSSQQILSEMDERGTTPERVEFENTVDFASEEELLSEMDEDEWTDRNFGASNAENNTSDEASDLSEDDDATPEGVKAVEVPNEVHLAKVADVKEGKILSSSDSDTEIASFEDIDPGEVSEEENEGDECEEDEEEEEEEECGGSTTEVETDSEFAEDPPHSVPGKIPTIVVDEPEQFIARLSESTPKSQPKLLGKSRGPDHISNKPKQPKEPERVKYEDLKYVEPVARPTGVTRALPRVYPILKKWEPLGERDRTQDVIGSKISNELKQKYLHGVGQAFGSGAKKNIDPAAQSHLTSVLDMISEKQKLLQPASQPSPAMQAFLEGTIKYKNPTIPPGSEMSNGVRAGVEENITSPTNVGFSFWPKEQKELSNITITELNLKKDTINMNRLNLEKNKEVNSTTPTTEIDNPNDLKAPDIQDLNLVNINGDGCKNEENNFDVPPVSPHLLSEAPSSSTKSSQCTVLAAQADLLDDINSDFLEAGGDDTYSDDSGDTDSETGSAEALSDLDDMDEIDGENQQIPHEPPRVEIEDEFGVTLSLDPEEPKQFNEPQNVKKCKPNTDEDPSISGMSWSDSKDSLSGMFLESELSDWSRGNEDLPKGSSSNHSNSAKRDSEDSKSQQSNKLPFELDVANLDFADIDGMSSPDDLLVSERKKLGYSKLVGEEESNGVSVPGEASHEILQEALSDSERSSTSTLGSASKEDLAEELLPTSTPPSLKSDIVEAVNPLAKPADDTLPKIPLPRKEENYAILDRVVPFSNARDSLDYRKTRGLMSPTKSKDLFSTYALPSSLGTSKPTGVVSPLVNPSNVGKSSNIFNIFACKKEVYKPIATEDSMPQKLAPLNGSPTQEQLGKSIASPNTVRKLDEINKERAMQSDLIRSMVMGRIRRSPEKNRRGSLGSLSPVAGTSSSSTSDSGELPKPDSNQTNKDGNHGNNESCRSSQNSILSHGTTGTDESVPCSTNKVGGEDEFLLSSEETSHSSSSNSRNRNIGGPTRQHYEPVFTSSPRFRNRPLFDSPLSIYQSVTNPPTPVNPVVSAFTPVTPVTPISDSSSKTDSPSNPNRTLKNTASPSFYRSMPDLSTMVNSAGLPDKHHKVGKVSSFATPDAKRWDTYKYASTVDREKARLEARERARLKSDAELGLSPADRHLELRDKLRRKLSCPEGDNFTFVPKNRSNSTVSDPYPSSSRKQSDAQSDDEYPSIPEPLAELSDNVALSIRHNVDFPIKNNPFLVSPIYSPTNPQSSFTGDSKLEEDGLREPQLRPQTKSMNSNRRKSPEKAKSIGWDVGAEPFPNYFSSGQHSQQQISSVPNDRSDFNWFSDMSDSKHSTPVQRARANTVSELQLEKLPGDTPGNGSSNYFEIPRQDNQGPENGALGLSCSIRSVCTLVTAYPSPPDNNPLNINKTKALSTDMLLDGSPLALAPYRGVSVPDVTATTSDIDTAPAASERKLKKSNKDRVRRRSLIQAVSDFFTKAPSMLTGSNSVSINENEKSSSTPSTSSSPGQPSTSKDKFSIFKLTPNLLKRDKRSPTAKSREALPVPQQPNQGPENVTPTSTKSARSSFISYLSQPEIIIQKLSSSPIPFKSSRAALNTSGPSKENRGEDKATGKPSSVPQPKDTPKQKPNPNTPEARRIREAREIQLQLESIETEQRRLESRGVTIEKRLRGEESDDENRDEVELMEEWFTLVREKTRLARFERELIVREKELELEYKQEKVEEKLEESLLVDDNMKSEDVKEHELEMWHELQSLERQRENLRSNYLEDIKKYDAEDAELEADLEARIASSSLTPKESNV